MKDIVLITNYWHFEEEKSSSRYFTLANMIVEQDINLEIVTSNFYHGTKSHRNYSKEYLDSFRYKITLVHESGYPNNISIKRVFSHKQFSKNVIKHLKRRVKPDVLYCVIPSLDVAYQVGRYAKKNGIKFIIDIQDLWPEQYKMIFNYPLISDLIFMPFKYKANKVYALADKVVAVSQTYVDRALSVNKKCKEGLSVFLGTELSTFDSYIKTSTTIEKPEGEIWITYIGTLGYSYDLVTVIDALKLLKDKGVRGLKFVVMGYGPLKTKFEEYAKEKDIYVEFTGRLEYSKMVTLLTACDIAVNPINKGAAQSIINKHADYLAASLPIVNTQENEEIRELLSEYRAGLNCINGDHEDLADKILELYKNEKLRKEMGRNSRKLAEGKFDRTNTYPQIVNLLLDI
ncbi:UNVERIFIED_CONTAM: glycosyltransferase involved in cell wall biosynthesis [Acetivibrio alkalicellulosi]